MEQDSSLQSLTSQYISLGIGKLTAQEEQYVLRRAQGINPNAAARSVGYKKPAQAVAELAQREDITMAISYMREIQRQTAIKAGAIEFTKDDATALYLEAHAKAANATEEIKAVDSLVKLHGLATPEKVEININTREQLQSIPDEELLNIAGQDILLSPDQYSRTDEED